MLSSSTISIIVISASIAWLLWVLWALRERIADRLPTTSMAVVTVLAMTSSFSTLWLNDVMSDDVIRYRWDGHLGAHAVSPYKYTPNAPELAERRIEHLGMVYPDDVPYSDMHTIYPPGAQHLFGVTAQLVSVSALGWKIIWFILVFSCLFVAYLWLPDEDEQLFLVMMASSPLFIMHAVADVHLDVLVGFSVLLSFLALRQNKVIMAGIILGAGISLKYLPVVAIPFLLPHVRGKQLRLFLTAVVATVAVAYLPFLDQNLLGNTGNYLQNWFANSLPYKVVSTILPSTATRIVLWSAMLASVAIAWWRWRHEPAYGIALALVGIVLFSPVSHAWYILPALILLPIAPARSVITWSVTSALYALIVEGYRTTGVWHEPWWLLSLETLPVMVAFGYDLVRGPIRLDRDRSFESGSLLSSPQ